jgi:type I restriction enzyme S subunit
LAGQSPDSEFYNTRGEGVPFLQGNAEFGSDHPSPTVFCTKPSKLCHKGDTLISVRAPVGEINRADQVYGLGRGLGAIQATAIEPDYLFHAMTRWRLPLRRAVQGSTFEAITARQFRQLKCCLPKNREERLAIVNILNQSDWAVQAAQARLEKAERVKTALFQQLFTKGLPGRHQRFKQTKLGEIPEEWDVLPLYKLLREPPCAGTSPGTSRSEPPGTGTLNVACIKDGICDVSQKSYIDLPANAIERYQIFQGDFFVIRGNGNVDLVGTGGLLLEPPNGPCIFSDLLIRLRFNDLCCEKFIPYVWQTKRFLHRIQAKAKTGSGLWKIGQRDLKREELPVPKPEEQKEIVAMIEAAQATIDAFAWKLSGLERLKYSLIQCLLTGRIRVRESQPA